MLAQQVGQLAFFVPTIPNTSLDKYSSITGEYKKNINNNNNKSTKKKGKSRIVWFQLGKLFKVGQFKSGSRKIFRKFKT